jgi:hypothetical protein
VIAPRTAGSMYIPVSCFFSCMIVSCDAREYIHRRWGKPFPPRAALTIPLIPNVSTVFGC